MTRKRGGGMTGPAAKIWRSDLEQTAAAGKNALDLPTRSLLDCA